MNTFNKREEETEVKPVVVEPVTTEQPTKTERTSGFLHSVGERIGLVSPTPNDSHFSKQPGLDQHTSFRTDRPTTINGAEHTVPAVIVPTEPKSSLTERAKDYMYGAGEWIGIVGNREDKNITDQDKDTWHEAAERVFYPGGEMSQDKLTEAGEKLGVLEKPASEKAKDKLTEAGEKVGLVEKPASEKAKDKLTEAGEKVGLVEKPATEKAKDKLYEAKDKLYEAKDETREAAEQAGLVEQKSFTERAKDYIYGVGERVGIVNSHPDLENEAKDKLDEAKDKLDDAKDKTYEAGEQAGLVKRKSLPEIAMDKIRKSGEWIGLVKTPPEEQSELRKPAAYTDNTELEGQKPLANGSTAGEMTKIHPA